MSNRNIPSKLMLFTRRINGCTIEYDLKIYQKIVDQINSLASEYKGKSDIKLQKISRKLKARARDNKCVDDLLVEGFALVREAVIRVLKLHPFDVQIIGGIVIHKGKIAEMQTGEGKTLTAVFPAYLNALYGKGVHVLTFNDYLARRDAKWMGPVYNFLGLSVGFVQEGMSIADRKKAYNSEITYLTAKESGFDYLRDSLCYKQDDIVHRAFNYAVIDEADSILIDEARVPLVIAGSSEDVVPETYRMARIACQLKAGKDIEFDEFSRSAFLTEDGLKAVESILKCGNLYDADNLETLTRINCAIHAQFLLHRDIDYIVRNGKVELVDEFTGRIADKRRWPDGLQAAIEAKENIAVQSKGNILNSITIQHFIQLYPKISGMTATAQMSDKEFRKFYNLHITVIPPNKPCIRKDKKDVIYQTKEAKYNALIEEITCVNRTGRPILVGTRSVEESFFLADALKEQGLRCEVLNARRDEFEAEIIARAGRPGAVTISTNMAGRGTDIRLGDTDEHDKEQVIILGGLYVIGTNRYESLRIDNQLRGRAGRQGDPGSSRFFISIEDDLFVKYGLKDYFAANYSFDKSNFKNKIDHIQRKIDGQNLEIKITLSNYSFIIEQQRKIFFQKRNEILHGDSILDFFEKNATKKFTQLKKKISNEKLAEICRYLSLLCYDKYWSDFLAEVADIREGIHLNRIGPESPMRVFLESVIELYDKMQNNIFSEMINLFNDIIVKNGNIDLDKSKLKAPSSTWTYLINDNPFESNLYFKIAGNLGLQVIAGLLWPLLVLYTLYKKIRKKFERNDLN